MGTLPATLKPFSSPRRPLDADVAGDQIRGNDNTLQNALNEHTQNAGLHTVTTSTSAVGAATAVAPVVTGLAFGLVSGDSGAGATFVDQVAWNGATNIKTVVSSTTVDGAPAARTYTVVAGVLKLAMAAGSYTIKVVPTVF